LSSQPTGDLKHVPMSIKATQLGKGDWEAYVAFELKFVSAVLRSLIHERFYENVEP